MRTRKIWLHNDVYALFDEFSAFCLIVVFIFFYVMELWNNPFVNTHSSIRGIMVFLYLLYQCMSIKINVGEICDIIKWLQSSYTFLTKPKKVLIKDNIWLTYEIYHLHEFNHHNPFHFVSFRFVQSCFSFWTSVSSEMKCFLTSIINVCKGKTLKQNTNK